MEFFDHLHFNFKNEKSFSSIIIVGVLLGVLLPRNNVEENNNISLDLPESSPWYGNEEIRIFREYLTIATVHPNIDYGTKIFHQKFRTKIVILFRRTMRSIPKTPSGKLRLTSDGRLSS